MRCFICTNITVLSSYRVSTKPISNCGGEVKEFIYKYQFISNLFFFQNCQAMVNLALKRNLFTDESLFCRHLGFCIYLWLKMTEPL